MRTRRFIVASAIAALAVPVAAGPALAAETDAAPAAETVYDIAIAAETIDDTQVEPAAIPAVVGAVRVGTALGRGFTAAKAPQQVSQVLRAGSFLHNFLGGSAHLRSNVPSASIDVIFDR